MKLIPLRLEPGQDLKKEILNFCQAQKLSAGFVISGIGSLKSINLRLANSKDTLQRQEFFEVLSIQGSLTENAVHLHMSVADSKGQCFGGHLMDGCEIYTTAEILIQEMPEYKFERVLDPRTGYPELKINKV